MVLKEKYSKEYLSLYIKDFINKYNDVLDENDIDFLYKESNSGIIFDIVPYLLTQFYNEYDLINPKQNIYLAILKKLKESFELRKKNIIEIGGGPIPTLSRLIANETEKEVTVYDPNITIKHNKISNLNIVKQVFLPYTDISKYDLAVSFMACGAQETVICNCAKNNKDFFIGVCPCGKEVIDGLLGTNLTNQQYIEGVIELANKKVKEYKLGKLVIDKLDDKYCYPFPIIYNKRTKMITYKKR